MAVWPSGAAIMGRPSTTFAEIYLCQIFDVSVKLLQAPDIPEQYAEIRMLGKNCVVHQFYTGCIIVYCQLYYSVLSVNWMQAYLKTEENIIIIYKQLSPI